MKRTNTFKTLSFTLFLTLIVISSMAQMSVIYGDTLNQILSDFANKKNMEGVASAVIFPDGSKWSNAEGNHGNVPLTTNMLFDIGSNTKSMISSAVLMLEEEGSLSIDDNLFDHIPTIPHVATSVTLKQLLSMRSGIADYTQHPNFGNAIFTDLSRFWHPDSSLSTFLTPPNFPPGTNWQYSNTNYLLLGKVIESVENKPLNQVLNERIFSPFNLDNTYLDAYDTYTLPRTGAYVYPGDYWGQHFLSFMSSAWAAGAVIATPEDFVSWCHQLSTNQILDESQMQKMLSGTQISADAHYGLGLEKIKHKGRYYLAHGGTTMQNSEMHYSLESDFSVVVMNLDRGFHQETRDLQFALVDLLEYAADQQPPVSVTEYENDMFVNAYPNPSNDVITLKLSSHNNSSSPTVKVYSLDGKLIQNEKLNSSTLELHKTDFGIGMFILQVYENGNMLTSEKIVFY